MYGLLDVSDYNKGRKAPGTNTNSSSQPPGMREIEARGYKSANGHLVPAAATGSGIDLRNLVAEYMRENYLERVLDMLGEPPGRYRDPAAWRELEKDLGVGLPTDYKEIVDGYAPVQINGHLSLDHPATERWNLGEWIRSTADAWSQIEWDEGEPEGDPRVSLGVSELVFGTPDGLVPLASTDSGETLFYAPRGGQGTGSLFVEDGEGEFFEYSMGFAEWLFRWLVGEEVTGPGGGAFYPGPVTLRTCP